MLVLVVVGLKGGIGKSTVAREIASALHGAKHRVLLVDADAPQETCRRWALQAAQAEQDGPPVASVDGAQLRRYLDGCRASYDVVVIDTARLETEVLASLMVADLVLLPVIPGTESLDALDLTLKVVERARQLRSELRAAVVLNLWNRTRLARLTREAVEGRQLPILAEVRDRAARREAMAAGSASMVFAPGTLAAEEVETLVRATLAALGGEKKRWRASKRGKR